MLTLQQHCRPGSTRCQHPRPAQFLPTNQKVPRENRLTAENLWLKGLSQHVFSGLVSFLLPWASLPLSSQTCTKSSKFNLTIRFSSKLSQPTPLPIASQLPTYLKQTSELQLLCKPSWSVCSLRMEPFNFILKAKHNDWLFRHVNATHYKILYLQHYCSECATVTLLLFSPVVWASGDNMFLPHSFTLTKSTVPSTQMLNKVTGVKAFKPWPGSSLGWSIKVADSTPQSGHI